MTIATFPGRLEARAYQLGLKPAQLAELADVPRSFIYDILRGRSKRPARQTLARVAEVLKVDVDWLISGKGRVDGEMPVPLTEEEDFVPIRLAAPRPSMGGGAIVDEHDEDTDRTYQFRRSWIEQRMGVRPSSLRLLHVEGDSMAPSLQSGDMVLVDMTRRVPNPPGIFVLNDGHGLVAKRIEAVPNCDPPRIRIISDNPMYSPYEQLLEMVNIVGRVRWFAREV
jgi:phage repressor protein C with HTH and peptisase S24 domain